MELDQLHFFTAPKILFILGHFQKRLTEKFNLIIHIFYKTAHHTGPSSTSSNCSTGIGL